MSFLSASNVFLIAIRLAPTQIFTTGRTPLASTFPVLFRLKWYYFIYSDQFLQSPLYFTLQPISLKSNMCLQCLHFRAGLVPSDRATCTIASRPNFIYNKSPPQSSSRIWCFSFERFLLYLQTSSCTQCNHYSSFEKIFITSSKHRNGRYTSNSLMLHLYQPYKTLRISYLFQSSRKQPCPSILAALQ